MWEAKVIAVADAVDVADAADEAGPRWLKYRINGKYSRHLNRGAVQMRAKFPTDWRTPVSALQGRKILW